MTNDEANVMVEAYRNAPERVGREGEKIIAILYDNEELSDMELAGAQTAEDKDEEA